MVLIPKGGDFSPLCFYERKIMRRNRYEDSWEKEERKEKIHLLVMLLSFLTVFGIVLSAILFFLPERAAIGILILLALISSLAMMHVYAGKPAKKYRSI